MAASSPALSNNSSETAPSPNPPASSAAAASDAVAALGISPATNASKNLRGLNKPKCIKCGNVARSRCPYQSCKSCCAKAQNPCHIHVLKGNTTLPDKSPSNSPLFDQQTNEASPSGSSLRVSSLRQLSNNFAQFNNLQSPLRSRKPLTRKDAAVINEWRFLKLKEYRDRNIETENEAFDRYMQNVHLLEEVFSANSTPEGPTKDGSPMSNSNPTVEPTAESVISALKLKLRSNPVRIENFRKRVRDIVDQGLRKLRRLEKLSNDEINTGEDELVNRPRTWQEDRASALSDLIGKLNKARNEEDLKACLELKSQIFSRPVERREEEAEDVEETKNLKRENDSSPLKKSESDYSPPKWFATTTIGQDALNRIDSHFCSLEEIEDL